MTPELHYKIDVFTAMMRCIISLLCIMFMFTKNEKELWRWLYAHVILSAWEISLIFIFVKEGYIEKSLIPFHLIITLIPQAILFFYIRRGLKKGLYRKQED